MLLMPTDLVSRGRKSASDAVVAPVSGVFRNGFFIRRESGSKGQKAHREIGSAAHPTAVPCAVWALSPEPRRLVGRPPAAPLVTQFRDCLSWYHDHSVVVLQVFTRPANPGFITDGPNAGSLPGETSEKLPRNLAFSAAVSIVLDDDRSGELHQSGPILEIVGLELRKYSPGVSKMIQPTRVRRFES